MKHIPIIMSSVIVLMTLSGCAPLDSDSGVTGGIMKSEDIGRTFQMRTTIDEKHSLAATNVLSVTVDPTNNSTIYVGTDRNELYVSNDAAATWRQIGVGLTDIKNVIIDPFNTRTIYVSGMYKSRGSVIRTDDAGANWRRVYVEPSDNTRITAMTISKYQRNTIYIGTSGGTIARTDNGGESWENLYHADNSVDEIVIDAGSGDTLYALINGWDVVRTRDHGMTFESVRSLVRDSAVQSMYEGRLYSMATSPVTPGFIVVGTDRGLYESMDYGQSWHAVDVIASTIGIPIHAVAISPHNGNQIIYAAAKAVYTSVPDGWAITDTDSNRIVDVIVHDPIDPNIIYIGLKKSK